MCGTIGAYGIPDIPTAVLEGLLMEQHRGQGAAGIVFSAGGRQFIEPAPHRALGLVERCAESWQGPIPTNVLVGAGHVRYGTNGKRAAIENAQPFVIPTRFGPFSIAHNGDIPGFEIERRRLERMGVEFCSSADTEVLGRTIAVHAENERSLREAILKTASQFKGAFSLVMSTPTALIGCRDTFGYRPLSVGKVGSGWVLASETCALDALRAESIRDVEPGELVWIDERGLQSIRFGRRQPQLQQCVFELIYFARPDSIVFGRRVDGLRKALGEKLAEAAGVPQHDNVVFIGVPDSAMFAAEGYEKATRVRLRSSVLIRNHYTGRTFIGDSAEQRANGVRLKFNPIHEEIKGKWVVLIDDSLVRGTTMRRLVRMMRENGATGVTLLIASPPILFPCRYGIDMKTPDELIAAVKQGNVQEICRFVEADELCYLSLEGLRQVAGAQGYCFACFDGKYAI